MTKAFIYDAIRTVRGKGNPPKINDAGEKSGAGALHDIAPHELGNQLIRELSNRYDSIGEHIGQLTLGCVGQVKSQGGHLALVTRLNSDLPDHIAVKTINNYCISSLTAINESAAQSASPLGSDTLTLAGGVEMMSQVPFIADKASYYSNPKLAAKLKWMLPVMGSELIAAQEGFTKQDLDQYTAQSHQRAAAAWYGGAFGDAVIPIKDKDGNVILDKDEWVRSDFTADVLATKPPIFAKAANDMGADAIMYGANPDLDIQYQHSIANCPGVADGASMALIGNENAGKAAGITPKVEIIATAEAAGDAINQFDAGFTAMEHALAKANLTLDDIDRIEFMEAFPATPLKFLRKYGVDPSKVNVNGGHLAMGHPMGATGGVLASILVHDMVTRGHELGMVVAMAAGGLGSAMIVRNAT